MGVPDPAPVPIFAQFELPILTCTVFFDRLLTPGPTASANWRLRANGREWLPTSPEASPGSVRFTVVIGGFAPGNRVSYLATPPDVFGDTGTPVEPFIGFPVTVLGGP